MKQSVPYRILFSLVIILCACNKKNNEPVPVSEDKTVKKEIANYKDSIYFSINEEPYIFGEKYSVGVGNRAVNIKRSATTIPGGKLAYITGGANWYGTPDSTLYNVNYGFKGKATGNLELTFAKKYKDSELWRGASLLYAKSHTEIFKKGNYSFATDYDKENTKDGIVIAFHNNNKGLSTAIPGFSILLRSKLSNDIQDNSSFEITKVEQIKDDRYLIEAKFEANLFDADENLYRLKNGFIRLTTYMTPTPVGILNF